MGFTLDSFAADVKRVLKEDASPAGRERVRHPAQEALNECRVRG